MTAPWIAEGRLRPPDPPPYAVARPRFVAAPVLTVLAAGPGYGKTHALAGLLAGAPEGAITAWLACDPFDADPAEVFHHLLAAVRVQVPGFGAEIEALLAGGKVDARQLWTRLFAGLAAYGGPGAWLALDDAHHLAEAGSELLKGLATALERLPPGVRVLVATRRKLALPAARLAAQGRARVLGPEALAFDEAEAAAFSAVRGFLPDATLAAELAGWPLGWVLVTDLGAGLDATRRRERLAAGALADYVAEELYRAHDAETRAFLRAASWLEELGPEDVRLVTGAPDVAVRLERLEIEHVVTAHDGGLVYRFPPHVRAFLREASRREDAPATRAGWLAAVAERHEAGGRPEAALPYRMAMEDWPAAARACAQAFPAMRFSGRHAAIARWLAAFPREVAEQEPTVLIWRGHARARAGDHVEALDLYSRARSAFEAAGDLAGVVKALVRLTYVALMENDLKRAGPLLMQAQARQADALAEDLADLHASRGFIAEQRGDLALMRECHEEVLAVPAGRDVEVAASHAVALINLYTAHLNLGDLDAAERAAARAVAVAGEWGFHPYGIFASFLRAHLALLRGSPEGADEALRGLPATWRDVLDWHDLGCADTILGQLLAARGDLAGADEAFKRAVATFEAAGFAQGLKLVAERQAWLALQRRQLARVAAIVAGVELTGGSLYDVAPRLPAARALDLAGRPGEAIALLDAALAEFEGLGAKLHAVRARLFRAAARLRAGQAEGARADLAAAEAVMAAQGYGFLREQDQLLWEELDSLRSSPEFRVPSSELEAATVRDVARDDARDQAIRELGTRNSGLGTKPATTNEAILQLNLLGTLEARVGGVLVDQWVRRKAQLALAALALYPRGLALPELAELMGGEEPGGGRFTTLKVAISYLRHALEPHLAKGAPSRFVLLEGERYRLGWDHVRLDMADFEAALAAGDRARAIALYRGNLLDEPFFQRYFEAEREKARGQAVAAALALAGEKRQAGDAAAAENVLTRIAGITGTDEAPYQALMDLYLAAGLPEKARQTYWDCRKARKAQLGLPPSEEIEAAYRALR